MPPPRLTIDRGDHHEMGEGSGADPRTVLAIDRLTLVDKDKRQLHIRLSPRMTAAQLRAKIEASGASSSNLLYLHADEA